MTPETRLRLLEQELERWLEDDLPEPYRERVHADRMVRILHGVL